MRNRKHTVFLIAAGVFFLFFTLLRHQNKKEARRKEVQTFPYYEMPQDQDELSYLIKKGADQLSFVAGQTKKLTSSIDPTIDLPYGERISPHLREDWKLLFSPLVILSRISNNISASKLSSGLSSQDREFINSARAQLQSSSLVKIDFVMGRENYLEHHPPRSDAELKKLSAKAHSILERGNPAEMHSFLAVTPGVDPHSSDLVLLTLTSNQRLKIYDKMLAAAISPTKTFLHELDNFTSFFHSYDKELWPRAISQYKGFRRDVESRISRTSSALEERLWFERKLAEVDCQFLLVLYRLRSFGKDEISGFLNESDLAAKIINNAFSGRSNKVCRLRALSVINQQDDWWMHYGVDYLRTSFSK